MFIRKNHRSQAKSSGKQAIRRAVNYLAEPLERRILLSGSYAIQTLASFNGTDGSRPTYSLIADAAGNLYGTTEFGGANNDGTVFEIAAGTQTLSTLVTFGQSPYYGINPCGNLVADSAGNLYGTTNGGGANGPNFDGTVFEIAAGTHAYSTLVNFTGSNGSGPTGGLILDNSGNLYGTTYSGGPGNGYGTIFEIAAKTQAFSTLATFSNSKTGPSGNLIFDAAGNLYGVTNGSEYAGNYGTVFECAVGTHTLSTVVTFTGPNGVTPCGGLTADAAGNLYGTTEYGGSSYVDFVNPGDGTVFEIAAGTHAFTTLVSFNGTNGEEPEGSVIADAAGNLYATTYGGGTGGHGTVFEVAAGSGTVTTLLNFNGSNGEEPGAALLEDASDNMFGTTESGGIYPNVDGTVFELTPLPAATITTPSGTQDGNVTINYTLASNAFYSCSIQPQYSIDGGLIWQNVTAGNGGDGTTGLASSPGGTSHTYVWASDVPACELYNTLNTDVQFRIAPSCTFGTASPAATGIFTINNGSTAPVINYGLSTLASFNSTDGATPMAGLVADSAGNLYGTTQKGGANDDGTVFELTPLPAAAITTPSGTQDGNVTINYTLASANSDSCSIQAQYSTNGGTTWEAAVAGSGGDGTTGLTSSPVGASHTFVWASDNPGTDLYDVLNNNVEFQITPSCANGTGNATATASFTIDNRPVAPVVTTNPTSQSVSAGDTATFTAAATGNPTPTVQWELSTDGGNTFTDISGATNTTYSFTATEGENGDEYEAVFTNSQGLATTTVAVLTMIPLSAPLITTSPISQSVSAGNAATFTAAASGNRTPTVQWELSTDGGNTFTNITGATNTTYSFTTTTGESGDDYQAVFSNSQGSATTTAAALTVTAAPVVTTNPIRQNVSAGNMATFTAAASGNPTPTVQWELSADGGNTFTNIAGATNTTYSFTTAANQNGDEYQAVFTNSQGAADTTAATLMVLFAPAVATNPLSQTVSAGQGVAFTAAATGNPTPTVQWEDSTNGGSTWANIAGATNTTYNFTAVAGQNGCEYQAVFTNSQGFTTTTPATLTVAPGASGPASVSGIVYDDRNGSGVKTGKDAGMADITVTLQKLKRNKPSGRAQSTTTNSNGDYTFSKLAAGSYRISEAVPKGYSITQPSTATYTINLLSGQYITGENFGDHASKGRRRVVRFSDQPILSVVQRPNGFASLSGGDMAGADGNLESLWSLD